MRNKGFFWFLTILLTAICVYQLSFTFVSNGVEKKAEKEAQTRVDDLKAQAEKNNMIAYLPNNTKVNFNEAEAEELAKSAFINQILKEKAETAVYPVFGSTFKDVKKRSLAFGLDLVGGMSVTLEVSVPELLKNYVRNERDLKFKKAFKAAKDQYGNEGGDFISIFIAKHNSLNPETPLVSLFAISDIDELGMKSTDEEVEAFLRDKEASSMDGVEEIMNRRINQFGVAQPNIQKDPTNNRLYIELPGVQDEATVAEKLQSTANLQFFETYSIQEIGAQWQQAGVISRTAQLDSEEDKETVVEDSTNVAVEDTSSLDLNDLSSLTNDGQKGLADLMKPAGGFSMGYCAPEDKNAVDVLLKREDILALFPDDIKFMWSSDLETINLDTKELGYFLYAVRVPINGKARVGGKDIKTASTGYDQNEGKITVDLQMTEEGGDNWAQMTQDNAGRVIAITMDDVVYSAPRVNEPITGGRTQISGSFTINEAKDLAGLLNGGALPAPCVIKEQTKVGPTIGAENASAGLMSFGMALLLVFIYMIFYYGKAGIIADIALFANILFIFGSLASFGAVLTLAGIAGIVLTIGMAVDANVLIFERVREEQTAGKDIKSAIDTGFKKALSSIIDANVTTLLTAIILKTFGSGPIESFATTLIIGIFTSVFAALVITRLCMNWWMKSGKNMSFETKTTKGAFKNFKFDFVGGRKKYYIISGILVAGGIVALLTKGLNPSVEFSGGRTFGVKFEQNAGDNMDYIRTNLASVFVEDGKEASLELKTKSNNFYLDITTNFMLANENGNIEVKEKLIEGLKKCEAKVGKAKIMESRSVSATVSKELISSSMWAILLSLVVIFAYILLRFGRWQYSTGAIIAMLHDVTLVLAAFAIFHGILPFNMDVDQAFIAAILTVIGYSINDTVVVFDRIRENLGLHKAADENEQINISLNSTLSRTINTSMTTFIVLLIIFLFGGAAIKGFIFALMIGVIVGTYSSLCIATPILIDFSKNKLTEDAEAAKAKAAALAAEKAEMAAHDAQV
ncbi:MAG: protein translocase subunit SecDF [Crocinitomicaceae bacterium]|nr:protein translocase subunit SecDF [Crocinitomicaceae bacterium]